MIRDKIDAATFDCGMPFVLSRGKGKRLWMKCNPITGERVFVVTQRGRAGEDMVDLNEAIETYNGLGA